MLELYSYFRSSCSWRVRLVLAIKRVQYEYRAVNLLRGEHTERNGVLSQVNLQSQVPILVASDDDVDDESGKLESIVLTQSSCIADYLDQRFPQPPLLPSGLVQRARVKQVCAIIESGIQPLQNLSVLRRISQLSAGDEDVRNNWARAVIDDGLRAVEHVLTGTAGCCCVGDQVTMADCFLVPQVYNARRFNVDLTQFPIIERVCCHLEELSEFKQAHPSVQPDCPDQLR